MPFLNNVYKFFCYYIFMIKKQYEKTVVEIGKLRRIINYEYENILNCNLEYEYSLNDKNKTIFDFFEKLISVDKNKKANEKFNKCTNSSIVKINNIFHEYIESLYELYDAFKREELGRVDSTTITNLQNKIDDRNKELLGIIQVMKVTNYNKYYIDKKNISQSLYEIETYLRNIVLVCVNYSNYIYRVDVQELKVISKSFLKEGDVIVEQIRDNYEGLKGRVISFFLDSPVIHVSMVYRNSKYGLYLFDAQIRKNNVDTSITVFDRYKNIDYIVLRPKLKISKKELAQIDKFVEEHISTPYSKVKTISLAGHRIKHKIFERVGLKGKRNSNMFDFSSGVFCSELISKVYQRIGINVSYNNQHSMVFPLDFVNSKDFEIVGVLK